jgi:hypothetical protein
MIAKFKPITCPPDHLPLPPALFIISGLGGVEAIYHYKFDL